MSYLIDSDWMIDAAGGIPVAVQILDRLSSDGIAISIITVAEIYEGAFGLPDPEGSLVGFREFLRDYSILPLTDPIAERFAWLRAVLRQRGQLIPDMDLLIAATALEESLPLVTRNVRQFARIPRLSLYRPE